MFNFYSQVPLDQVDHPVMTVYPAQMVQKVIVFYKYTGTTIEK